MFDWNAMNVCSAPVVRTMLTGKHVVCDVLCKKCDSKVGWMYEFAMDPTQAYKEAKVILEKALVRESDGIEEHVPPPQRPNHLSPLDQM